MVSYYHWLQTQTFDHPAVTLAKSKGFSGFLNDPVTQATLSNAPNMPLSELRCALAITSNDLVATDHPAVKEKRRTADVGYIHNQNDRGHQGRHERRLGEGRNHP